jgi:hypothetical protein
MNPTPPDHEMVEVRLRYRPVGDILTCIVSGSDPSRRFTTEPAPGVLAEWTPTTEDRMRLTALQIAGASEAQTTETDPFSLLPPELRDVCRDLIDPGRHHSSHPSTHRPSTPISTRQETVQITRSLLPELSPLTQGAR